MSMENFTENYNGISSSVADRLTIQPAIRQSAEIETHPTFVPINKQKAVIYGW